MYKNSIILLLLALFSVFSVSAATESYTIKGKVIDKLSRKPLAFVDVFITGQENKGTSTDTAGLFSINIQPGIYSLTASSLGYKSTVTPEYIVSAATPFINIELEEDATQLEAVTVKPSPFRRVAESPVSMKIIGLREIEKSPGSNRDISRIVRSYPGV